MIPFQRELTRPGGRTARRGGSAGSADGVATAADGDRTALDDTLTPPCDETPPYDDSMGLDYAAPPRDDEVTALDDEVTPAEDVATQWARKARDGDPVAQAAFVRATQVPVWRFVAALVDPDSADDLTQETYLRAFRALPRFEGRSSARTWLLGIARRACADHVRAVVRRRRLVERLARQPDNAQPDPAHQFSGADLLRRLTAERRSAFVLTQLLGLSYAEAAAVEGVPVGTIRSRVARARDDLVAAVGEAQAS